MTHEWEWRSPADPKAEYFEAGVATNTCGRVFLALTRRPSRAKAFKDFGARVYFRGIQRNQQDAAAVKTWLRTISHMLSY